MFGHKNVAGIPAIHYALRQIQTSTSKIRAPSNVDHSAHRAAMDAHTHTQARVVLSAQLTSIAQRTGASGLV